MKPTFEEPIVEITAVNETDVISTSFVCGTGENQTSQMIEP